MYAIFTSMAAFHLKIALSDYFEQYLEIEKMAIFGTCDTFS